MMSEKTGFVHLHCHSEFSVLDGMTKIRELFATAKQLGQSALCISDHGSTSGLWEAQKVADELGMKCIHASEFYYERENDNKNGHLLVLAKNNKGLQNIFKLQEYGFTKNFYYKPRIDWDILKYYSEGLITTSTCLGSTFNQLLIQGKMLEAIQWARKFHDIFQDDFYIELQPNSIPEQHIANIGAIRIAKLLGIKLVATNDVHYAHESDCFPHEVLLALQLNKKMSDEKRFKFDTNDFWLKSEEEMFETFTQLPQDVVIDAMRSTAQIADKCNARIEPGNFLPKYYSIPDGKAERDILVEHTMEGAREKGFASNKEYMKAVQEEIDVIDRNGYSGYFLIVQDYVNIARKNGIIVGDGRGSGAGSKVAYLTNITKIEPSEYDLLFERFMADGRQPDFDVDFSDQDAVFEDLQRKYGMENVARIIAFGTLTPRNVVRKVLNTFEVPQPEIGRITKLIPDLCPSLEQAYKDAPELVEIKKKYKVEWEVIERLEGIVSHESQHAGGVIIYPNLSSILPIKVKADDKTKRIVAFDKYMLEELGHYKFDILGLETLPVIKRALDSIREVEGIEIDLHSIDYDDQQVYDMLCKGDVSGVFQLANQAQKVMEQQPRNFRDIIAINSLIRPGVGDWNEYIARRKGKEWHRDPNRPWMHETEGVMTYQEQFLLDCHHLAGWDIAYADKYVRKAKDIMNDDELTKKFFNDSAIRGYDSNTIAPIWTEIQDAVDGGYSFNKSHSASYAMLSYQTAWLKCKYPAHFYASLMTSEGDDQNAVSNYVAECKQRGIPITPPNINDSGGSFVVRDGSITYRITTIRHVGESAINHIRELRPIQSFNDFMERREKSSIKHNVLVNLIKSGCFDFDNPNRAELLWHVDMERRTKTQIKEGFQCAPYEYNDKIKAEWEKESLGMYLSTHPMERYGFKPLSSYQDNADCIQGGEVIEVVTRKDKKGNDMAFITLDSLHGAVRVLVFSSTWSRLQIQGSLVMGNIVLVRGKRSGDSVLLNSVEVLESKKEIA
jgi:DNA polymerase-3 subunit alpha